MHLSFRSYIQRSENSVFYCFHFALHVPNIICFRMLGVVKVLLKKANPNKLNSVSLKFSSEIISSFKIPPNEVKAKVYQKIKE